MSILFYSALDLTILFLNTSGELSGSEIRSRFRWKFCIPIEDTLFAREKVVSPRDTQKVILRGDQSKPSGCPKSVSPRDTLGFRDRRLAMERAPAALSVAPALQEAAA